MDGVNATEWSFGFNQTDLPHGLQPKAFFLVKQNLCTLLIVEFHISYFTFPRRTHKISWNSDPIVIFAEPTSNVAQNCEKGIIVRYYTSDKFLVNLNYLSFILTHLLPITLSVPPENIRKPYGFLMFSGGRERVHWEQMC